MVSSEEFYALSQEEQQKLVEERRVIVNQNPVRDIPQYGAPIKILDTTFTAAIFDRLQNSRYTVSELADEIGVRDKHVRNTINKHRHRRFEKLLDEYNAVLRAKDNRGAALVYSLESIPYFARVMDPTLSCSLLGWNDQLVDQLDVTEWIPAKKVTEIDEDYAWIISNYWDLDPDDTFDFITELERRYVETSFGPLPLVSNTEKYETVRSRLTEAENTYSRRKEIDETTPKKKVDTFAGNFAKGVGGMCFYQSFSLILFDLLEYAHHEDPSIQDVVENQIDVMLEWLEPDPNNQNEASTQTDAESFPQDSPESSESRSTSTTNDEEFDWDERELLIDLVALTQELGRLPNETEINDKTRFSHRAYVEKFGSLMAAFRSAGILTDDVSNI